MRLDAHSKNPQPLVFEAAGRETIFDDGTQRVELYDVGPTPHAAHMLVAYFPKRKTLFVADLWDILTSKQPIAATDSEALWREVDRLGLAARRDAMTPVHGVPASSEDLKCGLAARAKRVSAGRGKR